MSMQLFSNNAESRLAASLSDVDTIMLLQSGHGSRFHAPAAGQYELITLEDDAGNREIVQCLSRSDDSLTIVRAQEGSGARPWNVGDRVSARITAATMAREAQGFDHSGDARGDYAIDLQSTRSDPSEVASGQYVVLLGQNATMSGDYSVGIGYNVYSQASTGVVCIGRGASTGSGADNAISMGLNAYIGKDSSDSMAMGANVSTGASDAVAIGSNSFANGAGSCAIGAAASANGAESVALGSGSFANGAGSLAFGNNAFADGAGAFALGANTFAGGEGSIAFCHDASSGGLEAIAIGVSSSSTGDWSVAVGKGARAEGSNSQALGANAQARLAGTTVMAGAIILPNTATFTSNPLIELAGAQIVVMSPVIDLLAAPFDAAITIPAGARFYVEAMFLLITAADTVVVQPTIRFGDGIMFDLLLPATQSVALDAVFKRQKFAPASADGLSSLSYGVTIAATATICQGRFGFVGILVENE